MESCQAAQAMLAMSLLCTLASAQNMSWPAPVPKPSEVKATGGSPLEILRKPGGLDVPTVRVVYLVPADREVRADYEQVIEAAIRHLQLWHADQIDPKHARTTFRLHDPIVEVRKTVHAAAWYASNPNLADPSLWFWFNALADAFAAAGGGFDDPLNRWVFYLDAEPACGQQTGAAAGVALLPKNDLRGLAGETVADLCTGVIENSAVCRWVGGLGHELGHAFGLPHPPGCVGGPFDSSLMCLGYITYPSTFLLPEDIAALAASPFFGAVRASNTKDLKTVACPFPR